MHIRGHEATFVPRRAQLWNRLEAQHPAQYQRQRPRRPRRARAEGKQRAAASGPGREPLVTTRIVRPPQVRAMIFGLSDTGLGRGFRL